jgi:hypothetical protein
VLVRQEVRFVYDQPRWNGKGTLEIPVDVQVKAKKGNFEVMVTTLNLSLDADVHYGNSNQTIELVTYVQGETVRGAVKNVLGLLK